MKTTNREAKIEHAKRHGYDIRKVPSRVCVCCGELIGKRDWEPFEVFARFGQMMFNHKECNK